MSALDFETEQQRGVSFFGAPRESPEFTGISEDTGKKPEVLGYYRF